MGGVAFLVRHSLRQHALSTAVTVVSAALASGLVMAVFTLATQTRAAFVRDVGFDAVVGGRGSQLQLVLNTVFHLETAPGRVPWSLYRELADDPGIDLAIPYAVGDNVKGFRLVGTIPEIFGRFEYDRGRRFHIAPGGRPFDPAYREGVLGATVAERLGLAVGDTFHAYHDLVYDEAERHEGAYTVTGVLEPTGSPNDRVVWIPIEGAFRMEGHVLRGGGEHYEAEPGAPIPDEHKEVSAVLLKFRGDGIATGWRLRNRINDGGTEATLAWPIAGTMQELFDKLFWFVAVLQAVAYLVVAVAIGAILASLYNTMNERRREFAILRALGAHRRTVFGAIVAEAATIAAMGAGCGYLVFAGIGAAAAALVRARTGVELEVFVFHPILWLTPLAMAALGALAGLLPAARAYATDVASNLVPAT